MFPFSQINRRGLIGAAAATGIAPAAWAQAPSSFPVELRVGPLPQPIDVHGVQHLVYELHLTSYAPFAFDLIRLEILGDARPLASYDGANLESRLLLVGAGDAAARAASKPITVETGRSEVIFLEVALPKGVSPAILTHRLTASFRRGSGAPTEMTVPGPMVAVDRRAPPVLASPLRGRNWVAFNAFFAMGHRRAILTIDGKPLIAQRYAIDWMQLDSEGRMLRGDPKSNASFPGYGAEIRAVADGRVTEVVDSIPENAGANEQRAVPITLETLTGNHVVQDIGGGRFAVYAHLQPGKVRVKPGARVRTGEVLGLLGNSGNSDAPHLHFHILDRNSAVGGEGLPYALANYNQAGVIDDEDALFEGMAWSRGTAPPVKRLRTFPPDRTVVDFG